MSKNNWKWDKWQQLLIDYEGSITIRAGRQSGKSAAASKRRADQMLKYPDTVSLMIAPAQRQSSELFSKTYAWLRVKDAELIKKAGGYTPNPALTAKANIELMRKFEYDHGLFNEIPTKTTIVLKKDFSKPQHIDNEGSKLYSLPAGKTGDYLRTFTLDFLDIDEAAYVPEQVYVALKPMLAISAKKRKLGWETFLSTPLGKGGFFYASHHNDDYRQFHVSSEDCIRISKEFLMKEKKKLTKAQYAQEWLGEFIDEWNQFFPTPLIKKCMTFIEWDLKKDRRPGSAFYLGMDIARYGGDENAFVIPELLGTSIKIVKVLTTERVSTTDTVGRAVTLEAIYDFKKFFPDDGGLGGAITDQLIEKFGKRRVTALNNASKRFEIQGEEKKAGILKEDLYSNALMLMETGKVEMISNPALLRSLKSITFEYTSEGNLKLFGDYDHLAEAFVRACWCIKERGLDLYVY